MTQELDAKAHITGTAAAEDDISKPTETGKGGSGWLCRQAKQAAIRYLRFESAKTKIGSYASPLLNLVPGVGPLASAGIGALAGTMSKLYGMAADGLEGKTDVTADMVADTIIADAKEAVPGLLEMGGKAELAKLMT